MKKTTPFVFSSLFLLAVGLSACTPSSTSIGSGGSLVSHTPEEVDAYMEGLKEESEADHLYIHYLRYDNTPSSYAPYDLWVWPFTKEGSRFDFVGRSTPVDRVGEASGEASLDEFGGAYVDVDLTKEYDGGWDAVDKVMGGTPSRFGGENGITPETMVGFQIVITESRTSSSGFWKNDGGDVSIQLGNFAMELDDGTCYHVFAVQDQGQRGIASRPAATIEDPFEEDDGTNVTYDNPAYDDVDWSSSAPLRATSDLFLHGDPSSDYLQDGAGTGYQIMVASFADSDGDGLGDIYGIDQKLDYLADLGVEVLWLTPIQLSNSYHGYDINDYTKVDPKFGSSASPNAKDGVVDEESAMEDYLDLLEHAHRRGMAVIMDLVINHTSANNAWFVDSAQLHEDYRGYYQWGNHDTQEGIDEDHYWYPYGDHPYSYYAKFGSSMPELNYSYVPTREAVVIMAKEWLRKGVDGFRMDAVKHIYLDDEVAKDEGDTIVVDLSPAGNYSSNLTKNLHFWRYVASELKEEYPDCFLVGENFDGHAYRAAPYYEGFDSLFDFYSYFNFANAAAYGLNAGNGKPVQNWNGAQPMDPYDAANDDLNLSETAYEDLVKDFASGSRTDSLSGLLGSTSAIKYTGNWNLADVFEANESYRQGKKVENHASYTFINGGFTSNHDIARMLNRVAGSGAGDLSAQGNVTTGNYDRYLKAATLAEIGILTLPGLSWLYYGDELGMSGNFKDGQDANSSYADLAYRQPMKWVDGGKVGDGSFTTGYTITGSGTGVSLDEVNSSSKVPSVATALQGENDHFNAIKAVMNLKKSSPALQRGSYEPYGWNTSSGSAPYVHNVIRTLGDESYMIVLNFSANLTIPGPGLESGTLVMSYNGASQSSMPPLSALIVKR